MSAPGNQIVCSDVAIDGRMTQEISSAIPKKR